ncbi:MAG: cyclic lactone autoinducer peptide [Eubacterium sp.]|nr:cyclic lactone autoinducer peptide [Eubacterium sp.]
MSKIKELTVKKGTELLSTFAMTSCKMAANTKCMCIFHQPEKPIRLKKFCKY